MSYSHRRGAATRKETPRGTRYSCTAASGFVVGAIAESLQARLIATVPALPIPVKPSDFAARALRSRRVPHELAKRHVVGHAGPRGRTPSASASALPGAASSTAVEFAQRQTSSEMPRSLSSSQISD
jgi:NhaP-type Na+/H+ or K+/H+ antiporter